MSEPVSDGPSRPTGPDRRLIGWMAGLAGVVLAVDQLTKYWAVSALSGRDPIEVIGELIQLRLLYNSGAAFSIGTDLTGLLTLVVVVVVGVVIRVSAKLGSRGWAVAFGLLLGGAFGNLVDRLFREPGFPEGHVVDFIDYAGFFVGNVADIAITAAAVAIALLTLKGIGVDGRRHHGDDKPEQ
ncbi:signal peptidase II [Haloactinopolyspora alba]|uniref:Lipoprotein signal peptidase n=1 Tax=Haloactinopolyspora alba TaxID=648780 RepID=A0A2P8E134_9ACTN|nr:signal peptidase II [Haloactinopolyspora alba]PSL03192.1 signal peptidase II [Haloactinopolyspora alba]